MGTVGSEKTAGFPAVSRFELAEPKLENEQLLKNQPAAGSVRAQFEWENEQDIALMLPIEQFTGQQTVHRTLFWDGHAITLPSLHPAPGKAEAAAVVRHYQPEILGLPIPVFVEETTYYYKVPTCLLYTSPSPRD